MTRIDTQYNYRMTRDQVIRREKEDFIAWVRINVMNDKLYDIASITMTSDILRRSSTVLITRVWSVPILIEK